MRRTIVLLGEAILRKKARPVKEVDARTRRLIDDLIETMHAADGLGLAAPQVGVAQRVLVARDGDEVVALINPRVKARRGGEVGVEGCLSMPGLHGDVKRATWIKVVAQDTAGRSVSLEAEDLFARVLQHEIDHLNGVLFTDHARELWWLEALDDEDADDEPALDEPATDATGEVEPTDEDEDGDRPVYQRVPTTMAEVTAWFEALTPEEREALGSTDEAVEDDDDVLAGEPARG